MKKTEPFHLFLNPQYFIMYDKDWRLIYSFKLENWDITENKSQTQIIKSQINNLNPLSKNYDISKKTIIGMKIENKDPNINEYWFTNAMKIIVKII